MPMNTSAKFFYLCWGIFSYFSSALSITCLFLSLMKPPNRINVGFVVFAIIVYGCSLGLFHIFKILLCKLWRLIDPEGLKIQMVRLSDHTTFWFPLSKSILDLFCGIGVRAICSSYKGVKYQFIPIAAISGYFGFVASFAYSWARGFGQMLVVVSTTSGFAIIFLMGDHLSKWSWLPISIVLLVTAGVGLSYWRFHPVAVAVFTEEMPEATELTEIPHCQELRDFAEAYHWDQHGLGLVPRQDQPAY